MPIFAYNVIGLWPAVDSDTIGRNQSFSGQLLSRRSNPNVLGAVVWSR